MKPRILFLPGFACTVSIWRAVTPLLAADCELTLLDWPREHLEQYESVDSLAHWLISSQPCTEFDLLVGHSMGGLVMLRAAALLTAPIPVGLVESFILSPGALFQNLLMPDADPVLAEQVKTMMAAERMRYSARLSPALRQLDVSGLALLPGMRVQALYGDRGCGDPAQVRAALGWPEGLRSRIPVAVVENACHFPMLENPTATAAVLRDWAGL